MSEKNCLEKKSIEDEDFQNSNLTLAVLSDEHKTTKIIVDVKAFGHAFGADLGRWRNRNVLSIYARAGVEKMAFVYSADYEGSREGGMSGELFETQHFTSDSNAMQWLMV